MTLKSFLNNYVVILLATVMLAAFAIPAAKIPSGMVYVKGGAVLIGSEDGPLNERPVHQVQVKDFLLDINLVTNQQFDSFIVATGYKTDAEKSGVGYIYDFELTTWISVKGANWQFPSGPHRQPAAPGYPVVQVSWQDAAAYCQWKGKRLPTEAEWEFAARQGINSGNFYSWGARLIDSGKYKANVWEGHFPDWNTGEDGFFNTSPVGWYGKTKNGLTDMGGNVWQWCADSYKPYNLFSVTDSSLRVCRGGSFLCDTVACYRVCARRCKSQELTTYDLGFRCAMDIK